MSDATETPAENTEVTDQASDAEDTSGAADQGTDNGGNDELSPEDLRKALQAARNEAARYRTNARELRTQLDAAKSPEDFQAVTDRAAQLEIELSNARLAVKYSLPESIANRIQGDTEEAREEDAKSLAALFAAQTESLGSGGLNPAEKETKSDPRSLAARVPRSRR